MLFFGVPFRSLDWGYLINCYYLFHLTACKVGLFLCLLLWFSLESDAFLPSFVPVWWFKKKGFCFLLFKKQVFIFVPISPLNSGLDFSFLSFCVGL